MTAEGGCPTSNEDQDTEACSLFKSDQQTALDPSTSTLVRLFNPRLDDWDEHFFVSFNSDLIQGLSQIGRATVDSLRMNRDLQREARGAWLRLGFYP